MDHDDRLALTMATIGFFTIAGLNWFFSTRPRLFVRVFVPATELRGAARGILRNPHFCRGARIIAGLQAAVATGICVAAAWCWFSS